ncbi:Uncharacterized protein ALO41_01995 [Pseudomonas amygdali pv. ulmi]|uniref:Uncharacterized protein n=1 Tax=Pseudomonas amygdali pv. ulmi TaxID=251720 RepID=A0A0Q0E0E1_PSEA0|nr:Arc family DNA-binding protein [Pseudomonas amygdali]KPZ14327.1 Uncharacterized protein ALO41_01995 [Pseudomonas amygdali pv. ulmi]KWS16186.1 hypothetical protein AL065_27000 [Pseudomonas amygdali pv. ulmi]
MQRYEGGSRGADKFVVRLPDDMRSEVERAAASSDTSMNTVVIRALRLYGRLLNRGHAMMKADASVSPAVPNLTRQE